MITQADGDGLPTMAEQAEAELKFFRCFCGDPIKPGWMHRADRPCEDIDKEEACSPSAPSSSL